MNNRLKIFSSTFYVVILMGMLAGMVLLNSSFIRLHPIEKKFLTPWLGMRTFLEIGSDPYGGPATQRTQLLFYGKLAESGQDPLNLSQPFLIEILYFPFALINNYTLARVVWMVLMELILFGSAFLILDLFDWTLSTFYKAAFIIITIFGAQSILPLIENDQVIFIFIFLLCGLIGLQKGLDELSGAAFALAFFQLSVTGIACLMIFWWVIKNRRWRVIWGAMMVWGFLIIASFGLFPGWLLPYIHSIKAELVFMNYHSTFSIFTELWPTIGTKIAFVLTIAIIIILILEWRTAIRKDYHWLLWVTSLTLAVYPLVGHPTNTINHIILFIPFAYILKTISDRVGEKKQSMIIGLFFGTFFLGGWAVVLGLQYIINVDAYNNIIFLGPSFLLIAGLYWIRWWATHPPRTWMDNIVRELN